MKLIEQCTMTNSVLSAATLRCPRPQELVLIGAHRMVIVVRDSLAVLVLMVMLLVVLIWSLSVMVLMEMCIK